MRNIPMTSNDDPAASLLPRRAALRRLGLGGLATGLLLGGRANPVEAQSTLPSGATEAAARRAMNAVIQALATGDMSVLALSFAADYVNHTPPRSLTGGAPASPDLAGLQASLTELRAAVPDAALVVDDVVGSGDTAAVRATFRGTVDLATFNLPAGTNPQLTIGGLAFARFVNGQVVESWNYDDAAETLAALRVPAATPTPTQPATPGEVREVKDFTEVALEGIGELRIVQGDSEALTIEAEEKVLKRIETDVSNGKLTIRPARSFNTKEPVTYYLAVKTLTAIEIGGSGSANAAQLTADAFRISSSAASVVAIQELTAKSLEIAASGDGSVTVAGAVEQQTITASGSAKVDASGLQSRAATVSSAGAAQVLVQASETLSAEAKGASRIGYVGNPNVQESTSGAASIQRVN